MDTDYTNLTKKGLSESQIRDLEYRKYFTDSEMCEIIMANGAEMYKQKIINKDDNLKNKGGV